MDWHWIDIGLASDWNGLALDCRWVGARLTLDWRRIGCGLTLDWDGFVMDWHWIDIGLASNRQRIEDRLALDRHQIDA